MTVSSDRPIVIYGASGHGLSVAMVLRGQSTYRISRQIAAFIDDTPSKSSTEMHGIPIVSFAQWSETLIAQPCLVSAGSSRIRRRLVARILDAGGCFEPIYPEIALPYATPRIGVASFVAQMVYIGPNVVIGDHVQIMPMTSIGHDVVIGDYATVCPGCSVSGHVVIEDGAFIGAGSTVVNGSATRPIVIGRDAQVAGGSVVTRSVAPGEVVRGNPARSLRRLAAPVAEPS